MLFPLGLLITHQFANHVEQCLVKAFHLPIALGIVSSGTAILDAEGGTKFLHQSRCKVGTPVTQQFCRHPKNCYEALIEYLCDSLGGLIFCHYLCLMKWSVITRSSSLPGAYSAPLWTLCWCCLSAPTPVGHTPLLDRVEPPVLPPQMLSNMGIPSLVCTNLRPSWAMKIFLEQEPRFSAGPDGLHHGAHHSVQCSIDPQEQQRQEHPQSHPFRLCSHT